MAPLRTGIWDGPTFSQVCDAIDMGSYTAKSTSLGSCLQAPKERLVKMKKKPCYDRSEPQSVVVHRNINPIGGGKDRSKRLHWLQKLITSFL